MTKKLDKDVKVLRACVRALEQSSSERMLRANLDYLYDRYVLHPTKRAPLQPTDKGKS